MQVQEIKKKNAFILNEGTRNVEVMVLHYYDNYLAWDTTASPISLHGDDHAFSTLLSGRTFYCRCCK